MNNAFVIHTLCVSNFYMYIYFLLLQFIVAYCCLLLHDKLFDQILPWDLFEKMSLEIKYSKLIYFGHKIFFLFDDFKYCDKNYSNSYCLSTVEKLSRLKQTSMD